MSSNFHALLSVVNGVLLWKELSILYLSFIAVQYVPHFDDLYIDR